MGGRHVIGSLAPRRKRNEPVQKTPTQPVSLTLRPGVGKSAAQTPSPDNQGSDAPSEDDSDNR